MPKKAVVIQIAEKLRTGTISQRKIAESLNTSRHLVVTVNNAIQKKNYTIEDIQSMDQKRIDQEFRRNDYGEKSEKSDSEEYTMPDFEYFASELLKTKLTY